MAATKLTCPDCGKVLRPAKPLPEGKKVKCPECGAQFAAVSEEPAVSVAKAIAKTTDKDKAAPAKKKAKKPASDKAPKKEEKKKNLFEDEDDGPATYGYVQEGEHEEPEVEHVPDESIKDLRGPAQAAVVKPSNYMIGLGAIGFFSYLFFGFIIVIPLLFPVPAPRSADGSSTLGPRDKKMVTATALWVGGPAATPGLEKMTKDDKVTASLFTIFSWDVMDVTVFVALVILSICFLGMLYCALTVYGAVRMQTLESRAWGIASSILMMMPALSLGIFGILSMIFTFIISGMFDEGSVLMFCPVWALASFGTNIAVGIWALTTLMKEEVVAGYEYVSDA